MYLSPRLKIIADSINSFKIIADIGSDHAYLPIYLLKNKQIEKAIATDVNKGPVEIAKKRVQEYRLKDSIEVRQGDGLNALSPNEADAIIVAGMGGILITEIIGRGIEIAKSARMLILQPMRDSDVLRRWLYKNSFHIVDEELVKEEDKIYEIIWAAYGAFEFDRKDSMRVGDKLIKKAHPLLIEFIENKIKAIEKIINSLENASFQGKKKKLEECRNLLAYYFEVIECAKQNVRL